MEYQIFAEWTKAFNDDEKVIEFRKIADSCGMNLVMPQEFPAPSLDYSDELPENLTPKTLIEVYKMLWSMQTASGIKLLEADSSLALSAVNDKVEEEFEKHRMEAY